MLDSGLTIGQEFWFSPAVSRELAALDLVKVLKRVCALPDWSQGRLAEVLGYSRPTINKVLNGSRSLQLDEAKRICVALGVPLFLVGFSARGDDSRSGLNSSTASGLRTTTKRFSLLERKYGGIALSGALQRVVHQAEGWVRDSRHARNLSAFGELAALAGYTLYDAQDFRRSEYYYSVALQAGYESGDSMLIGRVRALLSMRSTWLERGAEGSAHCSAALSPGFKAPSFVVALLLGRQARAEALRDAATARKLIAQSERIGRPFEPEESPIAYWSDVEFLGNAGIVYKELGDFAAAESHLWGAIQASSTADLRDVVLYRGMLARVYVKQNRRDEAVALALQSLSGNLVSARAIRQSRLFLAKTATWRGPLMAEARPRIRLAISQSGSI